MIAALFLVEKVAFRGGPTQAASMREVASRHFWQPSTGVIWVEGLWRGWGEVHTIFNSNLDLIASWTFPSNILHDSFCFLCHPKQNKPFWLCEMQRASQESVSPWPHGQLNSLPTNKLKSINSIQQVSYPNFFSFLSTLQRRESWKFKGFLWNPPNSTKKMVKNVWTWLLHHSFKGSNPFKIWRLWSSCVSFQQRRWPIWCDFFSFKKNPAGPERLGWSIAALRGRSLDLARRPWRLPQNAALAGQRQPGRVRNESSRVEGTDQWRLKWWSWNTWIVFSERECCQSLGHSCRWYMDVSPTYVP